LRDIDHTLPDDRKLFVKVEGGYDLAAFVQSWVKYNVEVVGREEKDLNAERAKHERIKAQKTELQVGVLQRDLVPAREVRRAWADIALAVRDRLLELPARVGQTLVMIKTAEHAASILDAEIRDVLIAIADSGIAVIDQDYDD